MDKRVIQIAIAVGLWICVMALPAYAEGNQPDWNSAQITWHDYEAGIAEAKTTDKPVLLLMYADWCPTCHAYKKIFYTPTVVELAQQFVMIRVNIDRYPVLNSQYNLDGGYVPRTYALASDGVLMAGLYEVAGRYKYFFKASEIERFTAFMGRALGK